MKEEERVFRRWIKYINTLHNSQKKIQHISGKGKVAATFGLYFPPLFPLGMMVDTLH